MIYVIGGSGFIGSRLCKKLRSEFLIIDKNLSRDFPEKCRVVDVRDIKLLCSSIANAKAIVNLAAEHKDDVMPKSLYYDVNVMGARNICQAARAHNITTIVFTSSVAVYGFAPLGTDEGGDINPFNDYGISKYKAEKVFKLWQLEDPEKRVLVILRPTVVFGEKNRGNVYNLLKQIFSGRFIMIGDGLNRKSMAYVENVADFIEYSLAFKPGIHIYNFADKPDYTMFELVSTVKKEMGKNQRLIFNMPYIVGLMIGYLFDFLAYILKRKFSISSIRVKKFCANSVYKSAILRTGFTPKVNIDEAITKTIRYEFLENHPEDEVFHSE
jgi:nucleoside-diphosphate-sugar epimerase